MIKDRTDDFFMLNHVDFAFDLCNEKEEIIKVLETSVPQKVIKFNSKGTSWSLTRRAIVRHFDFFINGGNLYSTDYVGFSFFDFLEFLVQSAYYDDKPLLCAFEDEAEYDCLTTIPIDKEYIRVTTFDHYSNGEPHFEIKSDIIIKKHTFLKQIFDLLKKMEKETKDSDKDENNWVLSRLKYYIKLFNDYFENTENFKKTFNPVRHIRAFDIAFKDLDGNWQFVVCLEGDERCDIEYWENQKKEGKILDFDYFEQYPESLIRFNRNDEVEQLTKEDILNNTKSEMSEREERNWVYSLNDKRWYASKEIMPEPERRYGVIHIRLSYDVEIEPSRGCSEDEALESCINGFGYTEYFLTIKCDETEIVSKFKFTYENNKQIREALEKAANNEYVRFDLGEYNHKMHIWPQKEKDYIAVGLFDSEYNQVDYFLINKEEFINCFISALDDIDYKINVIKRVLKIGNKLDIKNKFDSEKTDRYTRSFEKLDNFIGDYACARDGYQGWGIINKNIEWVIPPEQRCGRSWEYKYNYLHNIDGKFFIAVKKYGGKKFVMDINEKCKIPRKGDEIYYDYVNNQLFFIFINEGKTTIVNSAGKKLFSLDFSVGNKFWLFEDIIILSKDNKYGIVDWKGKTIIDFIFSDIKPDKNNLDYIPVLYMDKWGFTDKNGNIKNMLIKNVQK